jgi:hypothetical protein
MGFFSWVTQDTHKSISNTHSKNGSFKVHLWDDKGNVWTEEDYQGYGEFGGKNFYELVAEMNGEKPDHNMGVNLFFGKRGVLSPDGKTKYIAQGDDFFHWNDDKVHNGMSANQLLEEGWQPIHVMKEGLKVPNLTESSDWEWKNESPEVCIFQGYFYE